MTGLALRQFHSTAAQPRARGEEFGEAHVDEIKATVAAYIELFNVGAQEPVDAERLGNMAIDRIRGWAPEAADEIEGIARGCGLPPGMIGAINARTEILGVIARRARGECSVFLALSPTANGSFAAQTWDWHDHLADSWLVWTIELPNGRTVHTLTEFGVLGKLGINSDGIAVLLNILHHREDGAGIAVPVHVVARRILETATNLNDALILATGAPVSASTALTLVGHDEAECSGMSVELNPVGPEVVVPDRDGILARTNHFLAPRAAAGDREAEVGPDTFLRYDVLRRRIAASRPASEEDCFSLLRSHYGGGGAICAHPDPDAAVGSRYATLATIVFDFGRDTMSVKPAGPCSAAAPVTFETKVQETAIIGGGL